MIIQARFSGFPSGISNVGVGKLLCAHMGSLYNASKYNDIDLLVETLQQVCDYPITEMTDDDLRYLLSIMDRVSYTEDTRLLEWRCAGAAWRRERTEQHEPSTVYENPNDLSFVRTTCGILNTSDVRYKTIVSPARVLPSGMRHPRVKTLLEAQTLTDYPEELRDLARWVDSDWPLRDTIDSLTLPEIAVLRQHRYSCVRVRKSVGCNFCMRTTVYEEELNLTRFLRVFSETSMMNMQFNLNTLFNTSITEDTPIKTLLYHHGCYLQDKREADKKKREAAAKRR